MVLGGCGNGADGARADQFNGGSSTGQRQQHGGRPLDWKENVFVDSESEDNDGVSEDGEDAPSMHDQQEAQMQVEKETQIQMEKDAPPRDGNLETRRSVRLVKKKTKGVNSLYPVA
ncbi:hypothetical protein VPH35_047819 [Triticum aestivum]|uniref:uncharacterized protein n=1 Tax=Triticum aestivum TaxID=4565 RepID=UPI00162E48D4|nr:uncharacterized protein LOC123059439 [Triticum aestivum]